MDDPDESVIGSWVSPNRRWGIKARRMIFGVRISVVCSDCSISIEADYCAGSGLWSQLILAHLLMTILAAHPEEMTIGDFYQLELPVQRRKPIFNDKGCFDALCEMAGENPCDFWDVVGGRVPSVYINT